MTSQLNPLASIVVPVYNTAAYLTQCVESLAKQTYHNIEIILVDDGSTDASGSICDSYATQDSRIHVLHQKNSGAGLARNTGISAATGKWLAFVDSDDFLASDAIEKLVACGEARDADAVLFNYYYYDDINDYARANRSQFQDDEYPPELHNKTFIYSESPNIFMLTTGLVGSAFWRLDFIRSHELSFTQHKCNEEALFKWRAFLEKAKLTVLNEYLYFYREFRPGNSVADRREKFSAEGFEVLIAFKELIESKGLMDQQEEGFTTCQFRFFKYDYLKVESLDAYRDLSAFYRNGGFERAGLTRARVEKYMNASSLGIFDNIVADDKPFVPIVRESRLSIEKDKLHMRFDKQRAKNAELRKKNEQLRDKNAELRAKIDELKSSASYRIGLKFTWIPRHLSVAINKSDSNDKSGGNNV